MARRYNPLIDAEPTSCTVNGREYHANTDFRVVLAHIREETSDDEQELKTIIGLGLFFGGKINPDDVKGLVEWVDWFILRGEKIEESNGARSDPLFDYLVDSGRIMAAFLQVYGINLRRVRLHWWTFCELLEGLPGGTKLAEVVEIRRMKIEPKMKPSEKNAIVEAKKRYAIKELKAPMNVFGDFLRGIAGKARE